MLFTWSTKNLCIVFPQWRITGPFSLFVSLLVIVLLTAGYEGVRQVTRRYEAGHVQRVGGFIGSTTGESIAFYLYGLVELCCFGIFVIGSGGIGHSRTG